MHFKTALALLIAWLPGILGVYTIGQRVHVLLLVGLMLWLLSTARALEERRGIETHSEQPGEPPPPPKRGRN
jgi:hypothetical protein